MKWKYVPAMICLAIFGTLAYFAVTNNQPPAEHNLFAPNLMNRMSLPLPCPPMCENTIKNVVQSVDEDTTLVLDRRITTDDPALRLQIQKLLQDRPLVWSIEEDGRPQSIMW